MAIIDKITVMDVDLELHANKHGSFSLVDSDNKSVGSGDTLDKAKANARVELRRRRVTVSVPFVTLDGRRGVATTRSLKTRNVLCEIDGEKDEISGHRVFKPDIPSDVLDNYVTLRQRQKDMERRCREIEQEWQYNVGSAVDRAVTEAIDRS